MRNALCVSGLIAQTVYEVTEMSALKSVAALAAPQIKTFVRRRASRITAKVELSGMKEKFGHGSLTGLLRVSEAPYLATTTAVIL